MITQITFHNFKCLDNKTFDFTRLNIFTGYNGRGKSSVMQSILMLSQSVKKFKNASAFEKLHLNGDLVQLGFYDEILGKSDDWKIGFDIKLDNEQCKAVTLSYNLDDDIKVGKLEQGFINNESLFSTLASLSDDKTTSENASQSFIGTIPSALLTQFINIHYISADRLGPQEYVKRQEIPEFHNVGSNGRFTINTLSTFKDIVSPKMNVEAGDDKAHTLLETVSSWIKYIMDGGIVEIRGDKNEDKSSVLSLDFSMRDRSFRSYNVGFGYSYILPIVVTALIATSGSVVIIENPEAHLHPAAQLRMTELLAKLVSRGVQVLIETHSEHIVNGFRITALDDKFETTTNDVTINFFDDDYSIKKLKMEKNGRIANWPKGFFDQLEDEMAKIIRLGSAK